MSTYKKPTLDDVAREAGVSKSSVSMILSEKQGVSFSEETVDRVMEAAAIVGYVKKRKKFSHSNFFKYKTILLLTPSVVSPYYAALIQSIEKEAEEKHLRVIIQNTFNLEEIEKEALLQIRGSNIYGIIAIMAPQNIALLEELNHTIPVVIISDQDDDFNLDTIQINNAEAGHLVAKHMILLGHKHVAFISPSFDAQNSGWSQRLKAVKETYRTFCPEGSVTVKTGEMDFLDEMENMALMHDVGYNLTLDILSNQKITGIIAINDLVAYGVLDALWDKDLKVPDDYSVCGFDNLYPSQMRSISLTTVCHHLNHKGFSAVGTILYRYQQSTRFLSHVKVVLKHELVIRKSTSHARTLIQPFGNTPSA